MGNFNRGDKFGGKKKFGNDRGFGRGDRGDRPAMHQAVCAECGKNCEVPFRPSGDKPVYCSDCFGKKEGSGGNNRFERRDSGRSSFGDKPMFSAVCDKCGKNCEVPFRPTGDKPVFCSDCFVRGDKGGSGNAGGSDQKKQFEMLNNKLDSILRILSPKTAIAKTSNEVKPVVKAVVKPVEKKSEAKKEVAKKKIVAPKKAVKKVAAKKKKK
jgi:CxxC-x17-CxxC domain-containing protein